MVWDRWDARDRSRSRSRRRSRSRSRRRSRSRSRGDRYLGSHRDRHRDYPRSATMDRDRERDRYRDRDRDRDRARIRERSQSRSRSREHTKDKEKARKEAESKKPESIKVKPESVEDDLEGIKVKPESTEDNPKSVKDKPLETHRPSSRSGSYVKGTEKNRSPPRSSAKASDRPHGGREESKGLPRAKHPLPSKPVHHQNGQSNRALDTEHPIRPPVDTDAKASKQMPSSSSVQGTAPAIKSIANTMQWGVGGFSGSNPTPTANADPSRLAFGRLREEAAEREKERDLRQIAELEQKRQRNEKRQQRKLAEALEKEEEEEIKRENIKTLEQVKVVLQDFKKQGHFDLIREAMLRRVAAMSDGEALRERLEHVTSSELDRDGSLRARDRWRAAAKIEEKASTGGVYDSINAKVAELLDADGAIEDIMKEIISSRGLPLGDAESDREGGVKREEGAKEEEMAGAPREVEEAGGDKDTMALPPDKAA